MGKLECERFIDPVYRERYNEFLKRDFPRVPIINGEKSSDNFYVSEKRFRAYVSAGERLRKLHLMQEKVPAELTVEPNDSDNMEIDAVKYKDGILHINKNKRIIGVYYIFLLLPQHAPKSTGACCRNRSRKI